MSSSRVIPIAVATSPILVWLPFSTHSTGSDVPQELYAQKNSCWGFQITEANNKDLLKVKLLKFYFWLPNSNICYQEKEDKRKNASQEIIDWINTRCGNYDSITLNWKPELRDEKSKKLAAFSECLKFQKTMIKNSSETKLKFSIIGEII